MTNLDGSLSAFYVWRITDLGVYLPPVIEFHLEPLDCVDDFVVGVSPAPKYGTRVDYDSMDIPDGDPVPDAPDIWNDLR